MQNKKIKIYIDEAGRGPLAGPLYVGLVLPLKRFIKKDFKDSKSISHTTREKLYTKIQDLQQKGSVLTALGIVSSAEIDTLKITQAINLAIKRGLLILFDTLLYGNIDIYTMKCSCDVMDRLTVENLLNNPSAEERPVLLQKMQQFVGPIELVIDGKHDFGLAKDLHINTTTIVKGDQKNHNISIASILAKVSRDEYMVKVAHSQYPEYGFDQHMGYGTQYHRDQIKKLGPSPIHRQLFLRNSIHW